MICKAAMALFAILFLLCSQGWASTHPNQRKIGKWESGIAKRQAKIDAENARTPTGMFVGAQVFTQFAQPAAVVQPVAPEAQPEPQPEPQPAPAVQYVAPPVMYAAPPVMYVAPRVRYVAPVRVYHAVPVYRTYRVMAAPVLDCPLFGSAAANYHARRAEHFQRKADYHAARS